MNRGLALGVSLLFGSLFCGAGLMHFDDVADVVHKGEHAHREEANGVKGEERSDNELLRTDVFQETEDAVDSDEEF